MRKGLLCWFGVHPNRELRRVLDADPDGEGYTWVFRWSCRRCPHEWDA